MGHYWRLVAGSGLIAALTMAWPVSSDAQVRTPDLSLTASQSGTDVQPAPTLQLDPSRWEFSLDAYVGRPAGYIRVGENGNRGSRLRLNDDLGLTVSEALDTSVAFHLTPRDAVRASALYYFLRGRGLLDRSIVYNGEEFTNPGHVTTDADFYRLSLAYERTGSVPGGFLTGSLGLTYVHLDPKLTAHGHGNSEDFYRQELPVPIVGLRFDIPMGNGFAARASIGGGGLPRINSGRKEGGTVYLEQIHGDAAMALTYAVTKNVLLDIGPRLTYFFQHEKSHEDDNAFELIDYGLRAGVTFRF
jgi:hypothetical protein